MNLNPRLFRLFHKMPTLFWFRRKMFSLSALTESHWSLVYLFCSADVLSLSIASYSLVKISKVSKLRKQKIFHQKCSNSPEKFVNLVRSLNRPCGFQSPLSRIFYEFWKSRNIEMKTAHVILVKLTFGADLGSKSISVRKYIITGWKHLSVLFLLYSKSFLSHLKIGQLCCTSS